MRRYEVGTAAAILLIAAVAMFDTRGGALPTGSGGAPGGLAGGFYPFWSAALVAMFSALVIWRAVAAPLPAEGVFKDRTSVTSVLTLVVPMIIAVALIPVLGFYLMTALYMGFFAVTIGHYKWYWVIAIAVLFPVAIYLAFEVGFRVGLPKSIFYDLVGF